MPYYEVQHSYPLTAEQKSSLAQAITHLHATTFTTPSIFVNIYFTACDASDASYFVAGKPKTQATNRILGMIRTSASRPKSALDDLAAKIEAAWYDAVMGEVLTEGKQKGKRKVEAEKDLTDSQREATKLLFVVFHPMLAVRELGMTIPEAGGEGKWFKENMDYFKEEASKGNEDVEGLVKELQEREDLKKAMGGGTGIGDLAEGAKNLVMNNGNKKES